MSSPSFLDSPIEYLSGVGPHRGDLLRKELDIFKFSDLLWHIPYRYIDKTKFTDISNITEQDGAVQIKGILRRAEVLGEGRKQRMSGVLRDATGGIKLTWFQGVFWLEKNLIIGQEYIVYGKIATFNGKLSITHPEMEAVLPDATERASTFEPVYPSTEKLALKGLDAKGLRKLVKTLFEKISPQLLPETLPDYLLHKMRLPSLYDALRGIHFPSSDADMEAARRRLKFEVLFFIQLRMLRQKRRRNETVRGYVFAKIGDYFNGFYQNHLPFSLTGAQKRVLKEIRTDLAKGIQMNRLLQGDVGSGKTIVGFLTMLMAIDNEYQSCLMAPTEILAQQHYIGISELAEKIGIEVAFLSGSVKGKKRNAVLEKLASGHTHIIIGTHALLEDPVVFHNLGLTIIDEQHRFGVEQRARLWKKSAPHQPHVLVMSATPIPRTLAMTLYGDLEVSVIDELPPGRKPIKTVHRFENNRPSVNSFLHDEIEQGRQIYVVYPLIEESEGMDMLHLMAGFEALSLEFPAPKYQISMVHGKMKAADKESEMQRFVRYETQIMVATTVIEVGVNVPNASVMVIENTERFGLSQLHQLRGRVGRGAEQSFCVLISSYKLSADGRERIKIMCQTNDGFEIAEADLKLRGPGDLQGTQQSGLLKLRIADLTKDSLVLQAARDTANAILDTDYPLEQPEHICLRVHLEQTEKDAKTWGRIS